MSASTTVSRSLAGFVGFIAAAALTLALFSAPANAALPKTSTKQIVLGKSVAGVKLGMSMNAAGQIWKMPAGSSCFDMFMNGSLTCMFEVTSSGANYHTGNISYSGKKKVESILLRMPIEGTVSNAKKLLTKYKTAKKLGSIGLDTTGGKLRSKLGSKLKVVSKQGSVIVYQYQGPKTAKTDFVLEGGKMGRVVTIEMYLGKSKY